MLKRGPVQALAAIGSPKAQAGDAIIIVFPTHTDYAGKTVGALRVRMPPPKQATMGNGQPTGAKEVLDSFAAPPEPKPEPKPPLKDDLDDEINF